MDGPCGVLRVVIGGEAARLSKAFAILTDDLPLVAAAVVLMDKELQRRQLGHVTRTASAGLGLSFLRCGGHCLPPLCPPARSVAPKARRAWLTGRTQHHTVFR